MSLAIIQSVITMIPAGGLARRELLLEVGAEKSLVVVDVLGVRHLDVELFLEGLQVGLAPLARSMQASSSPPTSSRSRASTMQMGWACRWSRWSARATHPARGQHRSQPQGTRPHLRAQDRACSSGAPRSARPPRRATTHR